MTTWQVAHVGSDDEELNTAWDIWLGDPNDPNPSLPGTEIMIWLNRKQ